MSNLLPPGTVVVVAPAATIRPSGWRAIREPDVEETGAGYGGKFNRDHPDPPA